jgi:Leucine-rich repeat (LRR) protein
LDLSQQNAQAIYKNSLKGLFKKLHIENNIISEFETDAFDYMPYLNELSLANNLIRSLDFNDAFKYNQTNLTSLDFRFNKIYSIHRDFFIKFKSLKLLDLSNNKLTSIRKVYLNNLYKLNYLNLANNQILTIEESSFDSLISLKHLNLSNNLLYSLNGNLFANLSQLDELILGRNKLELIDYTSFIGLDQLLHYTCYLTYVLYFSYSLTGNI